MINKKSLKKIIKTILPVKLIKKIINSLPGLGSIGDNSWILRPRNIDGKEFVFIGKNTLIREHCWFRAFSSYGADNFSPKLVIGDNCYIGRYSCIAWAGNINIGSGSVLSEHVYIADVLHGYEPGPIHILEQPLDLKTPVTIGDGCFIGYRAAIMPGVQLGNNCVVAANSVVTKSFPAYSMVGGVPAKLIKKYSLERNSWEYE